MGATINFTKEKYSFLKNISGSGANEGYIGFIREGAVCCDLVLIADDDFINQSFCIGGNYAINADYYILGKDTGYGEINGIPYDCSGGFYATLEDTYEDSVKSLLNQFYENMIPEVREATTEKNLTWESVQEVK